MFPAHFQRLDEFRALLLEVPQVDGVVAATRYQLAFVDDEDDLRVRDAKLFFGVIDSLENKLKGLLFAIIFSLLHCILSK